MSRAGRNRCDRAKGGCDRTVGPGARARTLACERDDVAAAGRNPRPTGRRQALAAARRRPSARAAAATSRKVPGRRAPRLHFHHRL